MLENTRAVQLVSIWSPAFLRPGAALRSLPEGTTMQWIGETIESPATGSLDTDLEQGSTRSNSGATSFGYDLLHVLQAMRGGDFSVRMTGDYDGLPGKIAQALDGIRVANQRIAHQLTRSAE